MQTVDNYSRPRRALDLRYGISMMATTTLPFPACVREPIYSGTPWLLLMPEPLFISERRVPSFSPAPGVLRGLGHRDVLLVS